MTTLKCLAATTILLLSAHAVAACDDFDEEMAMAAAYDAAKVAQSQAPQPTSSRLTAAPVSGTEAGVALVASQETPRTVER